MMTSTGDTMDIDTDKCLLERRLGDLAPNDDSKDVDHQDDAHILELLHASQSTAGQSPTPNPPLDVRQLKAMVNSLLQKAEGTRPKNTREALRHKLRQKQQSRLSKYASSAQTAKRSQSTSQSDDATTPQPA